MTGGSLDDFYPDSCHGLSRREFLRAGALGAAGALAGVSVFAEPARAWVPSRLTLGEGIIRQHATLRSDPWAVIHGIRAKGKGFALGDGRPAVEHILGAVVKTQEIGGKPSPVFPLDVEVHTDSFLKTLLEANVPLTQPVLGGRFTLADVVAGAKARFAFDPKTQNKNDLAWSLIAFSLTTPPGGDSWVNGRGQTIRFADVVEFGFQTMEAASRPVMAAYRAGAPLTDKAPIHRFTCGGTHLLYSLCVAVNAGYRAERHSERLRDQLALLVYRLRADADLMGQFFAPHASRSETPWYRADALLKFVGHGFEILHYAVRHRLLAPTPEQAARIAEAWGLLKKTMGEVERLDLKAVAQKAPAVFKQIVGDTCHAHHGFALA